MRVENASVSYTQKFNLGNYESIELQVFLHGKVEEGESVEGCIQYLTSLAKEGVMSEAKKVTECHDVACPSVEKFLCGKPVDEFPSVVSHRRPSYQELEF